MKKLRENIEGCDFYQLSHCCNSKLIFTDICGDCKDHAETGCSDCDEPCEDKRLIEDEI